MSTSQGEARAKAEMERKAKMARWMNMPLGFTGTMFEEVDRRPATEIAHAAGKAAALQSLRPSPPHNPAVPQYNAWMEGYHEGQAVILAGIRPLKPTPPAPKADAEDFSDIDEAAAEAAAEEAAMASDGGDEPPTPLH